MPAATKTRLKKTNIGPSKTIFVLMVQVAWTSAPVVTMTARKDFFIEAVTVNTLTGDIVEKTSIPAHAGAIFYFVKSSDFEGLYYVNRVSGAGRVGCSCAGCAHFHLHCYHQDLALDVHKARMERARKVEAEEFAQAVAALPDQDATEMAAECPLDVPEVEPDLLSDEDCLQNAESLAERIAIWKRVVKGERARQKAIGAEYWGKVDELRSQAS